VKTLEGHIDFITAIDWNRDGNLLATASSVGEIRLWDVESEVSDVVIEQSPFVSALEWSPNDNRFAVGRADGAILIIKCDG
jgi:WD40 repeat protein